MYDYKNILFKSPIPFVIVEIQDGNIIIKTSNPAYKIYISEKNNLDMKNILKDCIIGGGSKQIKVDKKIYNLQIEEIDSENFIIWFCETEYVSNDIQEKLLLDVKRFDDVFLLINNGKILFVNDSYETLFGDSCKIPCDVQNGFYRYIVKKSENEEINYDYSKVIDERIKINTKCGSKWIWFRSYPILCDENKLISAYVILTDITNRTNYVIDKKETRDKFFSFVSHEIKNPLNMILATTQLVEKKVEQDIYQRDVLRHVELIKQNSFRIMKIVNDLSSKTKLDLGYFDFNPSNQDIVCFIENICESVRDFVKINNTSIIFDTDIEELVVGFDYGKIEKIVINLISNALKFRKEEGALVLITLSHDEDFVYIKVKDNGIGISKDNIDKIFKTYERVNDQRSIIKEGTGIGLSLVDSYSKMHGGGVTVESEVGEGTEFTVKISNVLCDVDEEHTFNQEERIQNIAVALSDI